LRIVLDLDVTDLPLHEHPGERRPPCAPISCACTFRLWPACLLLPIPQGDGSVCSRSR